MLILRGIFAMKIRVLPPSPPAGLHRMRLNDRQEINGRWDKPALRWTFEVSEGEHLGKQVTRITSTELRADGSLGEFLSELRGEELTVGTVIDVDDLLGRSFDVLLAAGDNGGVMIRKITPVVE